METSQELSSFLVHFIFCFGVILLQPYALMQDDIEKAMEKEMDKMQTSTEAGGECCASRIHFIFFRCF